MPSAKLAVAVGLAALSLSACGTTSKPEAGSQKAIAKNHAGVDDARKKHIVCLQQDHIAVQRITSEGLPGLQVETAPAGPTVAFEPTAGAAQEMQIEGKTQGAEVIGAALLYPNQASESLLQKVEDCVAQGVSG
jgi:hypothetical protein